MGEVHTVHDLRLVHFSDRSLGAIRSTPQRVEPGMKPRGLWVSVEGDDDGWSNWCEQERFGLDRLTHPHEILLHRACVILWLRSAADIDSFTEKFQRVPKVLANSNVSFTCTFIDWHAVGNEYQGIICAPYCWSRRLHDGASWYYGWDCASGCIWDAAAIGTFDAAEPFKLKEQTTGTTSGDR